MKNKTFLSILLILAVTAAVVLPACRSLSGSRSSGIFGGWRNDDLPKEKVEVAVNAALSDYRLSGSVSVKGIQMMPEQNSATADLQFSQFEYAVTMEGKPIEAANFNPQPAKRGDTYLPTEAEMFPPRKVSYSNDGKALLFHYTDGSWVLKEVSWAGVWVKKNVEIR